MSEDVTRLELAEERLDQVQAVLDELRKVLKATENVKAAAERGRADFRKVNLVVLASAIAVCIVIVVSRRGR
jgi:hypothetical protein